MRGARSREAVRVDRRDPALASGRVVEGRVARERVELRGEPLLVGGHDAAAVGGDAGRAPAGRAARLCVDRAACVRRRRGSAGSRCSGTGCRTARRRPPRATAHARSCRARTGSSRSPACRSRTASRGSRPAPAAPGAAGRPARASDSTVNTALPSSEGSGPDAGVDRLPASVPSPRDSATTTVHAPQSPSAQPSLVPVSWRVSRSHCEQRRLRRHAGDVDTLAVQHEADRFAVGAHPETRRRGAAPTGSGARPAPRRRAARR